MAALPLAQVLDGRPIGADHLTAIPPARAAMLRKRLPPTGVAAEFEDPTLTVGVVRLPSARMVCLFNWDDTAQTRSVRLDGAATVLDYWTHESLGSSTSLRGGRRDGVLSIEMAPRSARVLKVTP